MNYYERHLGDYARDTRHLTILEHGVYTLLLDRYYSSEEGIPEGRAYRLVGARTEDEKAAVDAILEEFFVQVDGFWRQHRADSVIASYRAGEPDRDTKKANERERQRKSRQRRADLFAELERHGVTAGFDTPMSQLREMLSRVTGVTSPVTDDVTSQPVTCEDTGIHKPVTNNQEREIDAGTSASDSSDDSPTITEAARACLLMRQAGCTEVNPQHPDLLAALAEGITPETLAATAKEFHKKAKPFAYAITTARNRHAEGPKPVTPGSAHANHPAGRSGGSKLSAVERVEAAIAIRKQAEASAEAQPAAQGLTADDRRFLGSDGHDVRA